MVQVQGTFSVGAFTVRKGSKVLFPCREESWRKHAWDEPISPGAISPCPQVTRAGGGPVVSAGLIFRREVAKSWGWSGLRDVPPGRVALGVPAVEKQGVSSGFVMRVLHTDLLKRLGLLLPVLSLPSCSLVSSWQLDSKGTPSLAHQRPRGKIPAAQKPAPAHYHTQSFLTCAKVPLWYALHARVQVS